MAFDKFLQKLLKQKQFSKIKLQSGPLYKNSKSILLKLVGKTYPPFKKEPR